MRRIATLLFATGIVGSVASAHDPQPEPRGCSAIEVTAPGLRKQPRYLQFPVRQILDLEFETHFDRPVYGDHVLRFRVHTPSGFLYQELTVPFTWRRPGRGRGDAEPETGSVRPASGPRGLPVQLLGDASLPGGQRLNAVVARLPVAGTSITMSTLYGRWAVQAFLDDRERPCSPLRRFTIRAD